MMMLNLTQLADKLDITFFNLLAMYWNGDPDKIGFHRHLINQYIDNSWKYEISKRKIPENILEIAKRIYPLKLYEYIKRRHDVIQQLLDLKLTEEHHIILQTILLDPTKPIYPPINIGKFILVDNDRESHFSSPTGRFSYQEIFKNCYDCAFLVGIKKYENEVITLEILDQIEWKFSKIIKPGMVNKDNMLIGVKESY